MLAWLALHYEGDVMLLHIGFPTPFRTRAPPSFGPADIDRGVVFGDGSESDDALPEAVPTARAGIQQKPEFMIQVCLFRDMRLQDLHQGAAGLFERFGCIRPTMCTLCRLVHSS